MLQLSPILETANGDRIVVHGEAVVQITIGSFKHQAKVLVADIVDTFILGLDLMDELDVKIDLKNKLLRIGNEEISAEETRVGRREQIKLILDQDTAMPANSEIIVKAHLERETDLGLVIVEPLEHEMEDLLTARCLVDSSDASHTRTTGLV